MDVAFLYVGDPMCSWCWGFSPELSELADRFALPIEVVVGGLRPGPAAQPLDERLREFLGLEWQRIADATGQPFDLRALEREGWVYDTEVADRAVVAGRDLDPHRAFPLFERIQRAFYAEGVDVTDPAVHPSLAAQVGLDPETFAVRLAAEEIIAETWVDFRRARALGATGFPTLLLRRGEEAVPLTRGYRPADRLAPHIEELLAAS